MEREGGNTHTVKMEGVRVAYDVRTVERELDGGVRWKCIDAPGGEQRLGRAVAAQNLEEHWNTRRIELVSVDGEVGLDEDRSFEDTPRTPRIQRTYSVETKGEVESIVNPTTVRLSRLMVKDLVRFDSQYHTESTHSGRVGQGLEIGLDQRLQARRLGTVGLLHRRTLVAQNSGVDPVRETRRFVVVRVCADPVVPDGLVRGELDSIFEKVSEHNYHISEERCTTTEYRCAEKMASESTLCGAVFSPSASMMVNAWLSIEKVKNGSQAMLITRKR